jgi:hypothetical protein
MLIMVRVVTLLKYLTKNPPNLLHMFYFPQSNIEYCRSKNCSAGNPTPFVYPGLKRTQRDAILK